ncbi:MAG: Gfo/Idh/MocA family oxidoreductase [Gemmatimonadetes bacterium]|nr:Gfo/Idh/MocA family oxidoreductase [Gemmatimonadota bacterium]
MDRRSFLKGVVAGGPAAMLGPRVLRAADGRMIRGAGPNELVNVACCGIGGQGAADITQFMDTGLCNIVALCDTDLGAEPTRKSINAFPNAARFQDFRRMFDRMGMDIDAVLIATPDHSHFPIAMLAMSLGKHIYVEKPMAHSYRQIDLMMKAAKKYRVATQMGNQGHSEANYFQFRAWTDAGIIRNVSRITAFMNSSRRWHGMHVSDFLPAEPIPDTLDFETWLATAARHPYNQGYMVGEWRSWYDFGNGALGDWGAHIFDTAHEFLQLGLPTEVEAVQLDGWNPFIFPQASTLAFRFPARGRRPPVELTWYDGQQNLPPLPEGFGGAVVDPNIPAPTRGQIDTTRMAQGKVIYGEGLTFKGGTHGATLSIIPEARAQEMAAQLPEVPVSPSNHYRNFLLACRGEEQCRSSFAVAGPLSQVMALGVIAQRVNGKLSFDPNKQKITNHKVANGLLAGVEPRKEWKQFYKLA